MLAHPEMHVDRAGRAWALEHGEDRVGRQAGQAGLEVAEAAKGGGRRMADAASARPDHKYAP